MIAPWPALVQFRQNPISLNLFGELAAHVDEDTSKTLIAHAEAVEAAYATLATLIARNAKAAE